MAKFCTISSLFSMRLLFALAGVQTKLLKTKDFSAGWSWHQLKLKLFDWSGVPQLQITCFSALHQHKQSEPNYMMPHNGLHFGNYVSHPAILLENHRAHCWFPLHHQIWCKCRLTKQVICCHLSKESLWVGIKNKIHSVISDHRLIGKAKFA